MRTKMLGRSNPFGDQVFTDRYEIIIDFLTLSLEACLVPFRPELTAASGIGDHINAAALQPCLAYRCAITWV